MRKLLSFFILAQFSLVNYSQIIADHSVVDLYDKIPQQWIDSVKTMWMVYAGESHAEAIRYGLPALEADNPAYTVSVIESGTPEAFTTSNLRMCNAVWGDYGHSEGWVWNNYGEEDWWTNSTAVNRIKAGLTYCNTNGPALTAIGFGWCWDATDQDSSFNIDPVYGVHWYGRSLFSPEGDRYWGIDDDDNTVSGNSVNMNTYLAATQSYIDYCADSIPTAIFFTTGPVDFVRNTRPIIGDEALYQGHLKYEHIRNYVAKDVTRILFDYADILCYNNAGELATKTWNGNTFPTLHDDNDWPASGYTGHIGKDGAVRLAKAMWWLLARIAGWDGSVDGIDTSPPSTPTTLTITASTASSVSISWNASTDNIAVTAYNIYRGGSLLGSTSELTYTDNTVVPCTNYTYTVSALDAENNESAQSSGVLVNNAVPTPQATLTQPTCSVYTGTIQITSPTGTGIEYSINSGTTWSTSTNFALLPANATYTVNVRNTTANPGCVSSASFTINPVPASPSAPTVSSSTPANVCPAVTVDLTSLLTSTTPTGGSLFYKTANNIISLNVANPAAVGAGSYYLFYQNQDGCYSTGTEIIVGINACNFPDITPTVIITPNISHGITSFNIFVRITELNSIITNGNIVVNIPRDSRWVLNGGYNAGLTILESTPLNNSDWSYSSDATNHIFTSSSPIPGGGFSTIGFSITFNPDINRGIYTITAQIESGGGGEVRVTNNVDSEKLDYFQE
ncbi:MAG: hypothetical protein K9H49_14865 [Bacteroidales bacterium]|nr:hypothetical protein [Bacteroidales bacterium]MCF8390629.1 hypothetical protein [Bacteroidales bacterium]